MDKIQDATNMSIAEQNLETVRLLRRGDYRGALQRLTSALVALRDGLSARRVRDSPDNKVSTSSCASSSVVLRWEELFPPTPSVAFQMFHKILLLPLDAPDELFFHDHN